MPPKSTLEALPRDDFVPIAVATLRPDEPLGVDLYMIEGPQSRPALYRNRDAAIGRVDLERLKSRSVRSLYIRWATLDRYQQYLGKSVDDILDDARHSAADRFTIVQDSAAPQIKRALRLVNPAGMPKALSGVCRNLVRAQLRSRVDSEQLFGWLHHDELPHTHAFNVAVYGVRLAMELDCVAADHLERIALGCLLHDVGERLCAPPTAGKDSPLTEADQLALARHPLVAFEQLRASGELDWGQLMMIYQHHERCDGGGYPVGVDADEIHWQASVCAVVDEFDMLTGGLGGEPPMSPAAALRRLVDDADTRFSRRTVQCWIATFRRD